jgi:hypothetical protein
MQGTATAEKAISRSQKEYAPRAAFIVKDSNLQASDEGDTEASLRRNVVIDSEA